MPQRHFGGCPSVDDESAQCTCEIDGVFCRCLVCRESFPLNRVEGQAKCPKCDTAYKPMSPLDDVMIKVNWWELQILASWAEAWANQNIHTAPQMRTVLYATARELEHQCPSFNPLTVAGDNARTMASEPAPSKIDSADINLKALITRPVLH